MFFHLLKPDHAHTGLHGLGRQVFQPALRGDAQQNFGSVFQQADRFPCASRMPAFAASGRAISAICSRLSRGGHRGLAARPRTSRRLIGQSTTVPTVATWPPIPVAPARSRPRGSVGRPGGLAGGRDAGLHKLAARGSSPFAYRGLDLGCGSPRRRPHLRAEWPPGSRRRRTQNSRRPAPRSSRSWLASSHGATTLPRWITS